MASSYARHGSPGRGRSTSPRPRSPDSDVGSSLMGTLPDVATRQTRQLQAFGKKVTATAGSLMGADAVGHHYHAALGDLHRELRRPLLQRSVFSLARTTPRELVRAHMSVPEIQHRALPYIPDHLLRNIPSDDHDVSLFQGFQASIPDAEPTPQPHPSSPRLLRHGGGGTDEPSQAPPSMQKLRSQHHATSHRLDMMSVRKHMCVAEIHEIDGKIANLNTMRKLVLDRLAGLEREEVDLEQQLLALDDRLDDLQEALDDEAALTPSHANAAPEGGSDGSDGSDDFMSESIYQKITTPRAKKPRRLPHRKVTPILHEHLQPGSHINHLPAHMDAITALDFDAPWGMLVTAALDDTVRVWDLSAARCVGMLEGHLSSVRCLQVEDHLVATGSKDATIRLWDLSKAEYAPMDRQAHGDGDDDGDGDNTGHSEDDGLAFDNPSDAPPAPPTAMMQDVPLFSLESHVDEVTALHFRGDTLVSGSADKTLRQWDLVKGRCVQTLDVLWAAAQAEAAAAATNSFRPTGRATDGSADFVGAVQVFDAALACGTADGMVRLWDLRSGQVHRSLVGHTGPVTALQFDDVHLVTASMDRSIRVRAPFSPLFPFALFFPSFLACGCVLFMLLTAPRRFSALC